jgi:hypothetical protein
MVHGCGGWANSVYDTELDNSVMLVSVHYIILVDYIINFYKHDLIRLRRDF